MRVSPCCGTKGRSHGAGRLICKKCGQTWRPRPKRRGRKKKRARLSLATSVMSGSTSLRGMAEIKKTNREKIRRRFHRSLEMWLSKKIPPQIPERKSLIAIVDALWFKLGKYKRPYTSFVVLLRPIDEEYATVALVHLIRGRESKRNWEVIFNKLPKDVQRHIVAVVSDGFVGMIAIAEQRDWNFQWCHVHIKRRMSELRGVRKLPGRGIRRRITRLLYVFLEADDEKIASRSLWEMRKLFVSPDCPRSIPPRISGVIKRNKLFRTYRTVPELNLPISTNSAENINSQIRRRLSSMRGLRSAKSLKYWLDVIHRSIKPVRCRGYKNTSKYHRKSVS